MLMRTIAMRILIVAILLSSVTVATALPSMMNPSGPAAPSPSVFPSPSILVGTLEFSLTNSSGMYNLIATLAPPPQNLTNSEVNTYVMLDTAQEQAFVNSVMASLQQYGLNPRGGIGAVIVTTTPNDFTDAQQIQFANELVSEISSWPAVAQYGLLYGGTQAIELTPVIAFWDQNAHIPSSFPLLSRVVNSLIVEVTNTQVLCFVAHDNPAILNPTVNVAGPIMPKISICPQPGANPVYLQTGSQRASPYSPRFIAGPGQKLAVIMSGLRSNSVSSTLPSLISLTIQGNYSSYQGDVRLEQCAQSRAGANQGICVRSGALPLSVNLYQQCSLTVSSCTSNYVAKVPILVGVQRANVN